MSPAELDAILTSSASSTGRKVDFVVLPEGSHHEGGSATLASNQLLCGLAEVVQRHSVWACLGTMNEVTSKGLHHCTALIVGPSGEIVTTYRKRATLGVSQTPGIAPCVFQTEHGLVGVMICYDAENPTFVSEALALEPVLMLNPVHISNAALRSGVGSRQERDARWRTSMESMGRHVDRIVAREQGKVSWVRCDQPYPIGAGTSQITEACRTQHVPTCGTTNWSVLVELGRRGGGGAGGAGEAEGGGMMMRWVCRPPKRERTDDRNNCGNRYTTKSVEIDVGDDSEEELLLLLSMMHDEDTHGGKYPKGVLHVLVGGERRTSVDVLRMAETHVKEERSETVASSGGGAASCSVADIVGTRFYITPELSSNVMKLMLRPAVENNDDDASDGRKMDNMMMKTSSTEMQDDECRHIFVAPAEGITAVAYLENPGVIVTLSPGEGSKASSQAGKGGIRRGQGGGGGGRRGRRVVTMWEFSQNRIPMPLHELLT